MTDGYERPSQARTVDCEVSYWFQGTRVQDDNVHGEACLPVKFDSEVELTTYLRMNRHRWEEIHTWRETSNLGRGLPRRETLMIHEQEASPEFALAAIGNIRQELAKVVGNFSLDAALNGNRRIPITHLEAPTPSGEYDATIPVLAYDAVYDENGYVRHGILVDHRGNPRSDVFYEEGVPYDMRGRVIPEDERRYAQ